MMRPSQRPDPRVRPDVTPRTGQALTTGLNEQLRRPLTLNDPLGLMRWSEGDDDEQEPDLSPDLGFDPEDDSDGELEPWEEPVEEAEELTLALGSGEAAFELILDHEQRTAIVESLIDEEVEAARSPELWDLIRLVLDQLEVLLTARFYRLVERLRSAGAGRLGVVGVTELAWQIEYLNEQPETRRTWISSFVNANLLRLPEGRIVPLAALFSRFRGADWELNQAIMEAARSAFEVRGGVNSATDRARAMIEDGDPRMRAWLGQHQGDRPENTVAKRLTRLFSAYVAEASPDDAPADDGLASVLDAEPPPDAFEALVRRAAVGRSRRTRPSDLPGRQTSRSRRS
jgi:hypothetical protein